MKEFTINVNLAGKYYPVKVTSDQERLVREAAEMVNRRLDIFRSKYNSEINKFEQIDFLAMAACQIALESLKGTEQVVDLEITDRIKELNKEVEKAL